MDDVLRNLTHDVARNYIGETFEIRLDSGPTVELTLADVVVMTEKHVDPRMHRDAFSLQFTGPLEKRLQQNTYPIHHPAIGGTVPMFIVPLGITREHALYEAVFN